MTVTQGISDPSGKEMIMFGKLEDKDPFKPQPMKTQTPLTASQDVPASIRPDPEWSAQAIEDAKQDFTSIAIDSDLSILRKSWQQTLSLWRSQP
jgi:hypothetical protein